MWMSYEMRCFSAVKPRPKPPRLPEGVPKSSVATDRRGPRIGGVVRTQRGGHGGSRGKLRFTFQDVSRSIFVVS